VARPLAAPFGTAGTPGDPLKKAGEKTFGFALFFFVFTHNFYTTR